MKISQTGLNLIKSFEGCRLVAYKAVSTEKYYTIGYGHYGADVTKGMRITQSKADALLASDLAKFETKVNKYQGKYNFNQNQFDALVSFAYNIGSIDGLTNYGKRTIAQISGKFAAYNKSGGKVLAGLTKRRAAEKKLFDTAVKNVFVFDGVDYSKVFDPEWYAKGNPDVVKMYGTKPKKLFEHFLVYGMTDRDKETGKLSRAGKTIATFNIDVYMSHSADLRKVFGDDIKAYYEHYCVHGYKEDRRVI